MSPQIPELAPSRPCGLDDRRKMILALQHAGEWIRLSTYHIARIFLFPTAWRPGSCAAVARYTPRNRPKLGEGEIMASRPRQNRYCRCGTLLAETGRPIQHLDTLQHWAQVLRIPAQLLWFRMPDDDEQSALAGPAGIDHGTHSSNGLVPLPPGRQANDVQPGPDTSGEPVDDPDHDPVVVAPWNHSGYRRSSRRAERWCPGETSSVPVPDRPGPDRSGPSVADPRAGTAHVGLVRRRISVD